MKGMKGCASLSTASKVYTSTCIHLHHHLNNSTNSLVAGTKLHSDQQKLLGDQSTNVVSVRFTSLVISTKQGAALAGPPQAPTKQVPNVPC